MGSFFFGSTNFIFGSFGDDTIEGSEGNDRIFDFGGNNRIIGGLGNDQINSGSGDDTLEGSDGNDRLSASSGSDRLIGGSGNDTLNGSFGDDTLIGNQGADHLLGGLDNDTFQLVSVQQGDFIDGDFDDNFLEEANAASDVATGDTLDLSNLDLSNVEGIFVDLDIENQGALNGNPPESQNGVLRVTQNGQEIEVDVLDVENIIGSSVGETLFGNNEANVILGGAGDDTIHPFGGSVCDTPCFPDSVQYR
jgi:Ca2+-binding RTX toxin-like protein